MNPSYVTSVQADASGNWQHTIPNTLPPGTHHVIVQDEEGNEQRFSFEVDRSSSTASFTIPTDPKSIPGNLPPFGMIVSLIVLGIVLVGFMVKRLILKVKITNAPKRKTQKRGDEYRK